MERSTLAKISDVGRENVNLNDILHFSYLVEQKSSCQKKPRQNEHFEKIQNYQDGTKKQEEERRETSPPRGSVILDVDILI